LVLRATALRAGALDATFAFGAAIFLDRFCAITFFEDLLLTVELAFAAFLGAVFFDAVFFATALLALGRPAFALSVRRFAADLGEDR
jgi:hypothetical protein